MISASIDKNSAVFNLDTKFLKEINDLLEAEIADTVELIADEARSNVKVEFGFLKGSINASYNGLEGNVKVTAKYAPYVEFGTGGLVDVPEGLESYAIQFKGRDLRQVNLEARPFLFPAFRNQVKLMENRLVKQTENLSKK